MLNSDDGPYFKKKEAFSFLLNTDGISICKKSKLTIATNIFSTFGTSNDLVNLKCSTELDNSTERMVNYLTI
jgi:hypothetical protein